ncbi:RNA-binding protein, putative (macronuclear) [Tetrahymena thermophila SB210]|uniref:RNA-binding protein, putative n=1 Tax=Tetrahymena thermophila (strain SB210) TaxID=312017 RepID=I7M2Z0_TETTS|nr:RNA-binding protein, putative [Tetrahymena thermophila SB210]EAS01738.2 RNA-binding protein, putative [Tetrahymena thermophila SB210]|eukprot:XP_001021983.2 RNA-binding protein, putative [Tetrahymena thermophila SB210]
MNKTEYTELIEKNIDKTLIDAFNQKPLTINMQQQQMFGYMGGELIPPQQQPLIQGNQFPMQNYYQMQNQVQMNYPGQMYSYPPNAIQQMSIPNQFNPMPQVGNGYYQHQIRQQSYIDSSNQNMIINDEIMSPLAQQQQQQQLQINHYLENNVKLQSDAIQIIGYPQNQNIIEQLKLSQQNCPICKKFINLQTDDFQVFKVGQVQKNYVIHSNCYQSYMTTQNNIQFVTKSIQHVQTDTFYSFDESQKFRTTKFIPASFDIFHPVSNQKLFRLEKFIPIYFGNDQNAYWKMNNQHAEFFEQQQIALPFLRSRCILTLHFDKEIYTFEFQWDFLSTVDRYQPFEMKIEQNGNIVQIGVQFVKFEKCSSNIQQLFSNLSQQNTVLLDFQYMNIKLPLKSNENPSGQNTPQTELRRTQKSSFNPLVQVNSPVHEKQQKKQIFLKNYPNSMENSVTYSPKNISNTKDIQEDLNNLNFITQDTNDFQVNPGEEFTDIKSYKDIEGTILNLAKTNGGSHQLQRFFHQCQGSEIDSVIDEIYEELPNLVTDSYANYMFQSLIQVCSIDQRKKILKKVSNHTADLVYDKKGTHSLQTLISLINLDEEIDLIMNNIQNKISELSQHHNATHFIQKIIGCFPLKNLQCIFDTIIKDIVKFGNNQHSLCVLKAMMTKLKGDSKSEIIIDLLAQNNDELIQNPFGNYAIQHAYDCYEEEKCEKITAKILEKLQHFSIQKYSSNVIEKCISTYCKDFYKRAIQVIIQKRCIAEFMKIQYGNFILQKLLVLSNDKPEYKELVNAIKNNINNIHQIKFKSKWQSFLDQNIQASQIGFTADSPSSVKHHSNTPTSHSAGQSYFGAHRVNKNNSFHVEKKSTFSDSLQNNNDSNDEGFEVKDTQQSRIKSKFKNQ